jgi:2-dehydro-3-deoxy-D-arabinonate dehydratase
MKICRFKNKQNEIRVGLVVEDQTLIDLTAGGVARLSAILESADPAGELRKLAVRELPRVAMGEARLCAPVDRQEVWAAGVTYLRSKAARMEESQFSANAYDRVYDAERPEIFFKALAEKVVGPDEPVGIRHDSRWSVPEPELALVLNSRGQIVGHTVGNDMSSRDIEGQNLLYLPQAKIYDRSCALGPWITLGTPEAAVREWKIKVGIRRGDDTVFAGETSVDQIKRGFEELAGYLFRSQVFPGGAVLLTGTGVVPPDTFTLREKDEITIEISGIGSLRNTVAAV